MITMPCSPSRMTGSPVLTRRLTSERPTTAGISRRCAMIAACDVVLTTKDLEHLGLRGVEVPVGGLVRRLEALDLGPQQFAGKLDAIDDDLFVLEDVGLADGDARARGDALDHDHLILTDLVREEL